MTAIEKKKITPSYLYEEFLVQLNNLELSGSNPSGRKNEINEFED